MIQTVKVKTGLGLYGCIRNRVTNIYWNKKYAPNWTCILPAEVEIEGEPSQKKQLEEAVKACKSISE